MRFSQKGAKSNRKRLIRSRYFKYLIENKEYFIKEKAYATHHDAWIDSQMVKKQTYNNAIKRGNECKEIDVKEEIMTTSLNHLSMICEQEHEIREDDAYNLIARTKKVIEKIKEDSQMSAKAEYMMFKKILNKHIKQIKGE